MAAVIFALGSTKPELRERQAIEVAAALRARPNPSAQSAASKIGHQARVNVDAGETRKAVELMPEEHEELAAVLNEIAWPDEPEYANLRRQLGRGIRGAPSA